MHTVHKNSFQGLKMDISLFDLFKIGVGPSSSHTVGPMRACFSFVNKLIEHNKLAQVKRIQVDLYGSLGATGKGHASDTACLLGLSGEDPETTLPDKTNHLVDQITSSKTLKLAGLQTICFDIEQDLKMHHNLSLDYHPNAMKVTAFLTSNSLYEQTYYSVGGGFIITEDEINQTNKQANKRVTNQSDLPYPFSTAKQLLNLCKTHNISISELMLENEKQWRSEQEIYNQIDNVWQVMQDCVKQGCNKEGVLPGGLQVRRRAKALHQQLLQETTQTDMNFALQELDWVNLYALAVNEENASGGRVVTAPTNGAAGIIPAVLHYYVHHTRTPTKQGIYKFFLAATAIGIIIKKNASISGAEVGCQGEVGSACAMAAAGLSESLGATPSQVENAAEIGIEHNLGLTCDPIGGLVQVPCIERNAMGAIKAINACRMARRGTGEHFVSLDHAIKTMKETGKDMQDKYKETSRGGLAINVLEVPVNFVDC